MIPGNREQPPAHARTGHRRWVRITHWLLAASAITLGVSGFVILMAHPRLYWGEAGNDLMPALIELPISRNHRHGGWEPPLAFDALPGAPHSASRTFEIFNQNGWGRSLHFLAGWLLVGSAGVYLGCALAGGHLRRDLLPRARELAPRLLWADLRAHLRRPLPHAHAHAHAGPPYGLLQKCSYAIVVLLLLPLMIATGLAMAPAIDAAFPWLAPAFGGTQSARTLHFLGFAALAMFLVAHVAMVVLSGFRRQLRAMTTGV